VPQKRKDKGAVIPEIQQPQTDQHMVQPVRTTDTEFQKFITDANSLDLVFKIKLCGWREVTGTETIDYPIINYKKDKLTRGYKIDENNRLCNESCCAYCLGSVMMLLNQLTTSGKLTEKKIYKFYDGSLTLVQFGLIDNKRFQGNTYQIKDGAIPDIISFLTTASAITAKAIDGFTLTEIAESILTQTLIKRGIEPQQHEKGFLEKAISAVVH
jgi:hypothetical protein